MSVATEQLMVKMPESRWVRVHKAINRVLGTILMVLGIIILGAVVLFGWQALTALDDLSDQFGEASEIVEEPVELNDGGQDYFPTPVAPDPDDPYAVDNQGFDDPYGPDGYIGNTNPDGTPCVGYGCTPEMDTEILEGEAEANE